MDLGHCFRKFGIYSSLRKKLSHRIDDIAPKVSANGERRQHSSFWIHLYAMEPPWDLPLPSPHSPQWRCSQRRRDAASHMLLNSFVLTPARPGFEDLVVLSDKSMPMVWLAAFQPSSRYKKSTLGINPDIYYPMWPVALLIIVNYWEPLL